MDEAQGQVALAPFQGVMIMIKQNLAKVSSIGKMHSECFQRFHDMPPGPI